MKKAVADQWVAALRSGKYKQGTGQLRFDDKYCCLGVLCAIAPPGSIQWEYDGDNGVPPYRVWSEYAGMTHEMGKLWWHDNIDNLIDLNDVAKWSFDQIADLIEKHWKVL